MNHQRIEIKCESMPERCGPDEMLRKVKPQELPRRNFNPVTTPNVESAEFLRATLPISVPVKIEPVPEHKHIGYSKDDRQAFKQLSPEQISKSDFPRRKEVR